MFDRQRLEQEIHELKRRMNRIERNQVNEQEQINQIASELGGVQTGLASVSTGLSTVSTDLATARTTLQSEIDALASANPTLDLSSLTAAVAPLEQAVAPLESAVTAIDGAAKALGEIKPTPVTPSAPIKSVYTHNGEGEINATDWTASGFETVPAEGSGEAAQLLYYFSGDNNPGETNGTSPEWVPYTGAVQAVPAA